MLDATLALTTQDLMTCGDQKVKLVLVTSKLIRYLMKQHYGKDINLYLGCGFFEGHAPGWLFVTRDIGKATNFYGYAEKYIQRFVLLLPNETTCIAPSVQEKSGFKERGYIIRVVIPMSDAPRQFYYVHPFKWTEDPGCARLFKTYDQALRVNNGQEPESGTQLTFLSDLYVFPQTLAVA